ncbi:MAG: DNA polymerase III subunit beta [bacterium]
MKIISKKELLLDQFQKTLVSNIKSPIPILNNIFFEAKNGYLTTISTDLNISIRYKQKIDIEKEGLILLPGKKLTEIINNLEDDIIIEIDNLKTKISSKNSIFHLMGISPEEFPIFPEIKWDIEFKISSNILLEMIRMVIFSASQDETLIPFCGIYLELEDNKIKMVTSDKFRLSVVVDNLETKNNINLIIPIKSVYEIIKVLRGIEKDIKVYISEKEIGVETENILFISRQLEGKFPDYNKIIPKEPLREIELDRDIFNSVLKRVSLITQEGDNSSRFIVEKNKLSITAESSLGDVVEEIEIDYKGDEFNILFNPKYILDILRNISSNKIIFAISNNIDKGIIKIKDNPNIIYIIMPVRE